MPPVYYPSRVVRYTNSWPANPSQIVIASGLGSDGEQPAGSGNWDPFQALDPTIYYQNDPSLDGYNPNEEHALLLDGVVYALRDDLNQTNSFPSLMCWWITPRHPTGARDARLPGRGDQRGLSV